MPLNHNGAHPALEKRKAIDMLLRDSVTDGAIKAKSTQYLPVPNPDEYGSDSERYQGYLQRAVYVKYTQLTVEGSTGEVMRVPPKIVAGSWVDESMEATLINHAAKMIYEVCLMGRAGLWVDYQSGSISDDYKPTWSVVEHENILWWNTDPITKDLTLVMWRTVEDRFSDDLDFTQVEVIRQFVKVDGKVLFSRWVDGEPVNTDDILTDHSGAVMDQIPFLFAGAYNNDPMPDNSPVYSIATLNLSHYLNSAEYEDSVFMLGRPTPYITGLTKYWLDDILKDGILLGSSTIIPLPEGASAGLLQADPNTLASEAMLKKEQQIIAIGGQMVGDGNTSGAKTATEIINEKGARVSILAQIAINVSYVLKAALMISERFNGETSNPLFDLNVDFNTSSMTVEERQQLLQEYNDHGISFEEYRDHLRGANIASDDDATVKAEEQAELDQLLSVQTKPHVGSDDE